MFPSRTVFVGLASERHASFSLFTLVNILTLFLMATEVFCGSEAETLSPGLLIKEQSFLIPGWS